MVRPLPICSLLFYIRFKTNSARILMARATYHLMSKLRIVSNLRLIAVKTTIVGKHSPYNGRWGGQRGPDDLNDAPAACADVRSVDGGPIWPLPRG